MEVVSPLNRGGDVVVERNSVVEVNALTMVDARTLVNALVMAYRSYRYRVAEIARRTNCSKLVTQMFHR